MCMQTVNRGRSGRFVPNGQTKCKWQGAPFPVEIFRRLKGRTLLDLTNRNSIFIHNFFSETTRTGSSPRHRTTIA